MPDREPKRRRLNQSMHSTQALAPVRRPRPRSSEPPDPHLPSLPPPPAQRSPTPPSPVHSYLRPTHEPTNHPHRHAPPTGGGEEPRSRRPPLDSHLSTGEPALASLRRPVLASSHSGETVPSAVVPGDEIKVDGYRDVRVISTHYDDVVACRAISATRGDQRVALKFSLSAKPSAGHQFKAETDLLNKLRDAGVQNISRVIARESGRYGPMMVVAIDDVRTWTEVFDLRRRAAATTTTTTTTTTNTAAPLAPYWLNPSDLVEAIDRVIRLVTLVDSIHANHYVHNSIRPSTISLSMFSDVYLHDFSCAFATTRGGYDGSTDPIRERGMKEESLPYLAPECSGRVARSADYRGDYYSIGATMFEVLTGRPPFSDAEDPLDVIHSHITKRPPLASSIDPSVPHRLALIVAKLLEKSPDARYQSAPGLIFDLEQVKEHVAAATALPASSPRSSAMPDDLVDPVRSTSRTDFTIGGIDDAAHFKLPPASKLFGREASVRILRASFERVKASNKPAVVVVKGHAGIGKTSLVETLRRPALDAQGHFTGVKFDQIKSPVPFFAITQALSGLFRQLLSEPEARLAVWRRRLQKAMAKEARILVDVLPSVEQIFEPGWLEAQPAIPHVTSAQENEERFQSLVQRVLRMFSRAGKPLVIVFDDLQWSTPSDLSFIRSLAAIGAAHADDDPLVCKMAAPMLLLCAWRDNEVGPDHIVETQLLPPLATSIDATIVLDPLSIDAVGAFVGTVLRNPAAAGPAGQDGVAHGGEGVEVRRLAQLILEKTGGSPLFVAQLLKSFNSEGLFTFDFGKRRWEYDLDLIASKSVSTNVVDLLLVQMRTFSPRCQQALKVAACLGNEELDSRALASAAGVSLTELARDLSEAVAQGLLEPRGSLTPVDEEEQGRDAAAAKKELTDVKRSSVPASYRFFHDRCQQAAYALIAPDERSAIHYRIGRLIVSSLSESAVRDRIFDIVEQLNHGIQIATLIGERDELARYNLVAGRKAYLGTAFEASRRYLQVASDLLGQEGWTRQLDLASQVTDALIDVEYSLTDYPAAQEYVRLYLDHVVNPVARLRVYARAIRCASATGDSLKAIDIGREGLAMAGVVLPDQADEAARLADRVQEQLALDVEGIKALERSPVNSDPVAQGCQSILAALVPPVYFTRIDLLGALSSLSLDLSASHGLDDNGAFMLTLHAILVRNKYKQRAESQAYGQVAIGFFERHGGSPLACPTYKVYSSHVAVWSVSLLDTLPTFRQAVTFGMDYRDAEYAGFGCGELCAYGMFAGVPLPELAAEIEHYGVFVRKFRHELSTTYIGIVQQVIDCFLGRAPDPIEIIGEAFSLSDYTTCRDKNYVLSLHMYHMFRLLACIIFGDFDRAVESVKIGRETIDGASGLVFPVIFRCLEAVVYFERRADATPEQRQLVDATLAEIADLADAQETSFRPFDLWLQAEAARVDGDKVKALALFDEAISAATTSGQSYLVACVNERAATTLANAKLATGYLTEAYTFWTKWGCVPKVQHLERTHPGLFPSLSRTPAGAASLVMSRHTPSASTTASVDHRLPPDRAVALEPDASSSSGTKPEDLDGPTDHSSGGTSLPMIPQQNAFGRSQNSFSHSSHGGSQAESTLGDFGLGSTRSTSQSKQYSRSHLATELDLRTVVTASSVISGELSVDGVVSKLLNLALRTAGADTCLLVLDKAGTLCAEAVARSDVTSVHHLRRTDAIDLQPERFPCSVINYVARTREMLVNSLESTGDLAPDPYLASHQPKSILCLALASQRRVIGVLYMENSQTTDAFTPDRLEILALISGQAASTIEKARLLQDLERTNETLKQSQAALESSNRTLESRIAERTIELRRNNLLLQAEVTEKERAQAEMRNAKEVAESATAMKSQFLANMSHEIRTPFNAVVALSGLLLETALTPVQADYVETIKNSSQELLVVINDILDYSKIESDRLELVQETVSLRLVIESSLDMVAERAASKSIELAVVIEEGDITIVGDLSRLRQIIVNLLSNAVKFTSKGEITVTASSEAAEPAEVGRSRRRCRVSVADTGIGIAKEHFGRLFRVFSQADGSETFRNFGGTGLGLAISRKLSRLMNGDLTVESVVGKGSTFTVDWIAPAIEPTGPDLYSAAYSRDLAGKRCLVVDANETSQKVLKQLLASFGVVTDTAIDVSSAFKIAAEASDARKPHDLIILDAFLPSFGAQVLLRRLRQRGLDCPAIALTRMGSPIYEEIRQLDCKFLIKPIKRNRLHHTLRTVFPAGDAPQAASPAPVAPTFPSNLAIRNPLSILCAEDNPVNVKVITHLLKRMGYSCDIAEDGSVAVDKAQKKRYDLILMDLNMPKKDGLQATREIIELMPDSATRPSIVCLTANAMAEDRLRCLEAGADGYVSKPILVPELVATLNEAGARRGTLVAPPPPSDSSSTLSNGASVGRMPSFELELPTTRLGRRGRSAGGGGDSTPGRKTSQTSLRSSGSGWGSGPSSPAPTFATGSSSVSPVPMAGFATSGENDGKVKPDESGGAG
ncbi:hypothetical protein JCM10212_006555 [Sporobolomyces blumeae]